MIQLPIEILRRILRDATSVPSMLDPNTAILSHNENRPEILRLIRRSMFTKRSLSLVSKFFHNLAEEYLFEHIYIKEPSFIRPLVILLRRQTYGRPKRGWWCRRLHLDLRYDGRSWNWGRFSLWGLIPACPQLVILQCHFESLVRVDSVPAVGSNHFAQCPVSPTLLQLLATYHQSTLRHLELTGQITAPLNLVERVLCYLPKLEICRLLGVQSGTDPYHSFIYSSEAQSEALSHCRDYSERMEYQDLRVQTSWPHRPEIGRDGILPSLPALHTLDISQFSSTISNWHLPSVQTIGAGVSYRVGSTTMCTNEIRDGISVIASRIRKITCYPNQSQGIDIWSLACILPNLEELEYHVPEVDLDNTLSVRLRSLHSIVIHRSFYNIRGHKTLLVKLYDYRHEGYLPHLQIIHIMGSEVPLQRVDPDPALVGKFAKRGVRVYSTATERMWIVDLI